MYRMSEKKKYSFECVNQSNELLEWFLIYPILLFKCNYSVFNS